MHTSLPAAPNRGLTIRRVWLGEPRTELIGRQRAVYDSYAGGVHRFTDDQTVTARSPDDLVERLHDTWRTTGADAINLRVHLPGLSPHEVR